MKTCGKVGQSENFGRFSLISGSANTSTKLNSTSHAFRASHVRIEKPHCGKSGVPFIKITTGFLSRVLLIRSIITSITHLLKNLIASIQSYDTKKEITKNTKIGPIPDIFP
jgi:hypothetical protein